MSDLKPEAHCMNRRLFRQGDLVEILPSFQDPGDGEFLWVAVDDEEKGRVWISAINSGLRMRPVHVVQAEWIRLRQA
jgi:hypothetical protein